MRSTGIGKGRALSAGGVSLALWPSLRIVTFVTNVTLPRWTSENRPYVDTSKPANGAEPEQEYLYLARGCLSKHFFRQESRKVYTDLTWAEGTATQGCDRSADSAAGMARGGVSRPASLAAILARSVKSQGFGDSVPKLKWGLPQSPMNLRYRWTSSRQRRASVSIAETKARSSEV